MTRGEGPERDRRAAPPDERPARHAIAAYPDEEQPPGSWWLPASYGGSAPTPEEAARLDAEEKARRAAESATAALEPT